MLTALRLKIGTEPHRGSVGSLQVDAFKSEAKLLGLSLPQQSALIGIHLAELKGQCHYCQRPLLHIWFSHRPYTAATEIFFCFLKKNDFFGVGKHMDRFFIICFQK